jgi:ribosomal protein L23
MNIRGKWRRVRFQPGLTRDMKKAIVTLKKGEKIDITA